jgi:beta-lactam-binding protein with PASTA domain
VSQLPLPGTMANRGSAVDLVIAVAPRIAVPNLVGVTTARAKDRLASVGLVLGAIDAREPSESLPPGVVQNQTPIAGARIAKGEAVAVVAAALATLPDLRGKSEDIARKALAAQGLRLGKVEARKSTKSPAGTVIEQRPGAGDKLSIDARVDLVIASAPDIDLPELAGIPLSKARELIVAAGLSVGEVTKAGLVADTASNEPIVRSQSPAAHTHLKPGSRVDLAFAEPGVRVPVVTGMTLERARTVLREAGLGAGSLTEAPNSGSAPGWVTAQAEAPGRVIAKGGKVDLTVAAAQAADVAVKMPNLVGMSRSAAFEQLRNLGFKKISGRVAANEKLPRDQVFAQTPAAGAAVGLDAAVVLDYAATSRWVAFLSKPASCAESKELAHKECAAVCGKAGGRWGGLFDCSRCGCDF